MINKMKKKITILFVMALAYFIVSLAFTENENSVLYSYNTNMNNIVVTGDPGFINCIFNANIDTNFPALDIGLWLNEISDTLMFNTVHMYGGWGSKRYGWFGNPLDSQQKANVKNLMDSVSAEGLYGLYGRAKIERSCYFQRLIYEVSSNNGNTTTNDGFCYSVIPDSVSSWLSNDSGRTVRYCNPGTHKAGYICETIYENFHHNDLYDFVQADILEWYMKPMMRIDTADFSPTSNVPVVAIIAKSFADSTLDSVIISVRHFRNEIGQYFGRYIEKFTFEGGLDSLTVSGGIDTGLGHGIRSDTNNYIYDYWEWEDHDSVDFEVYWFGQVKVWFDKMTVDDFYANELFRGDHDDKIEEEVDNSTSHPTNLAFFRRRNYLCKHTMYKVRKRQNAAV